MEKLNFTWKNEDEWQSGFPVLDANTLQRITDKIDGLVDSTMQGIKNTANGNYIRYENGLQICFGNHDLAGGGWSSITFPIQFSAIPYVVPVQNTQTVETSTLTSIKHGNVSTTNFRAACVTASGYGGATKITYIAIGRYK